VEHVASAQSQRRNNRSKLKNKEYNADQIVVIPTCNFHTLEANGSECCLQGQPGPHTQNMSLIRLQKWHKTQTKPKFHNAIEIK
jgi:hypothetical protein